MEAVEPTGIGNELGPFGFEYLPDRLLNQLRMAMRLGVGDAFIEQPGVQLVIVFEPKPRGEEAFTDQPDLVLDLPLLPAGGRRAGDRIDQIMAAHLLESAIVKASRLEQARSARMLDQDLLQVEDRVRLLVNAPANERDPFPVLKLFPSATMRA